MMAARYVIIPAGQNTRGLGSVIGRQRRREPSVRQRMQVTKTFRQVVKWHHVGEAALPKHALDRHVGRCNHADGEADARLVFLCSFVRTEQPHVGPIGMTGEIVRVSVNSQGKILADRFQEIAREPAKIPCAIKREWAVGWNGSIGASRCREFVQQHRRLAQAWQIGE